MMKKILFIIICSFFLIENCLAQQEIEVEISIDKEEVLAGEEFRINVSIKRASFGNMNISGVNIPGVESFANIGSSRSTQVQIVNNQSMSVSQNTFTYRTNKVGDYQIGPIQIKTKDNKIIKSNIVNIKVKASGSKSENRKDRKNKINKNQGGIFNTKNLINLLMFLFLLSMIIFYRRMTQEKERIRKGEVGDISNKKSISKKKLDIPKLDDKDFYKKAKQIILDFLEEEYKLDIKSSTNEEIFALLDKKNISRNDEIKKAFKICETGQFAVADDDKQELIKIIKKLG